jgi:ketosteroid isomerase-like protein
MSQENVELVTRLYDLWNEGPSARAEAEGLLHPGFEYVNPPDAVEPGTLQGAVGFDKVREIFPDLRVEPERFIDIGDDVVAIIRVQGRTEQGVLVDFRGGDVWTVRDGKATRVRWFTDAEQALAAVGLAE